MTTLFKTYGLYTKEEIDQMCKEIIDATDAEPTESDIDEYVRTGWEDFLDYIIDYDYPVAILGSVKRWDGTYKIADLYHFDDIREAIKLIIKTNTDDFEVYEDNDELCISTYNHDGGCAFEIKRIIDDETEQYDKAKLTLTINEKRK